jgi:hypothetical protein
MSNQAELFRTKPDSPDLLAAYLLGRGWMMAREILEEMALPVTDSEKRWLRRLAEDTADVISGQRGYCHIRDARSEEIEHAANWLTSQGKLMIRRALRMRRRAHQLVG